GCREGRACYEIENKPGIGDAAGNAPAPPVSPLERRARRVPAVQPPVLSHRTPPLHPPANGSVPVNRGCRRSLRQATENSQLPDIWNLRLSILNGPGMPDG